MGERSKVLDLPEAKRAELDQRLFEGGFRGYVELEAWLRGQGFEISKSALHRYGSKLEERMAALQRSAQQAKALIAASPDEQGDMTEATIRLLTEKAFSAAMDLELDPEGTDLPKLIKAYAPLVRAQIAQKKFAAEVRERTSKVVDEMVQAQGMDEAQARFWREKFLGVVRA